MRTIGGERALRFQRRLEPFEQPIRVADDRLKLARQPPWIDRSEVLAVARPDLALDLDDGARGPVYRPVDDERDDRQQTEQRRRQSEPYGVDCLLPLLGTSARCTYGCLSGETSVKCAGRRIDAAAPPQRLKGRCERT